MRSSTSTLIAAMVLAGLAPEARAQQVNLGGGLIEFLATGQTASRSRYGAPQQAPQPAPQSAATPGYYPSAAGRSYYAEPAEQYRGPIQRATPRPSYATAPDALPDGLTPGEPATPPRRGRSSDLAYASMPRVSGFDSKFEKQMVDYDGRHGAGTVVIDTEAKFLYLVQGGGKALRYGIGVGRPGFEWAGNKSITRKAEWPSWTPPSEMLKRRPDLPRFMKGGEDNPLGARALYLGSSLYRIHGTNEPSTIGQAVSSGCIRMRNADVIDLYDRVGVGTRVVVM